jgi:hypothetical protein
LAGVQEAGGNSSGGAMPISANRKTQFARERGFVQPPSVGCKLRRKESSSLNQNQLPVCDFSWPLTSGKVRFEYGLTASDGVRCAGSEPGKLIHLLGDLQHVPLHRPSLGDFEAAS